jgi:hypothetical protein
MAANMVNLESAAVVQRRGAPRCLKNSIANWYRYCVKVRRFADADDLLGVDEAWAVIRHDAKICPSGGRGGTCDL